MLWILILISILIFAFLVLLMNGADLRKRDEKYRIDSDNEQMKILSEMQKAEQQRR